MPIPLFAKLPKSAPWILGVLVAGVLGGTVVIVTSQQRSQQQQVLSQLTVPVVAKDLTVRITANGTLVPVDTVNLSPKLQGRVAELRVEQGDRVKQGQVVARMESRDLEAQLAQYQASLAQAEARLTQLQVGTRQEEIDQAVEAVRQSEAQVAQADSRLSLARERARRNQDLLNQGAISQDRLDEVLNEERTAQASLQQVRFRVDELSQRLTQLRNGSRVEDIDLAAAQVDEAAARLQGIQVQLEDTLIRAPFSGTITQKYAVEGAFVAPTTSASSTTSATSTSIVALTRGMEVLAKVPEVDISRIHLGQKVEVTVDAYPDQVFEGQVRLIAPAAIEEQSVTSFQVRVTLVTGQEKLRQGLNATLMFLGEEIKGALVVPTVAIVTKEGQTGVFIPDGNKKPQFRKVTIGPSIGDQTQILQGLQTDERVFVDLPKDSQPKGKNGP